MHTRTNSTAKAKAAKLVIDKPWVGSVHEPFWFETFSVGEYFRIDHNRPNAERVSHRTRNSVNDVNSRGVGINSGVFGNQHVPVSIIFGRRVRNARRSNSSPSRTNVSFFSPLRQRQITRTSRSP